FKPYEIGDWFDCGKVETLLETNRILLEGSPGVTAGVDSIVIAPCFIAEDATIENSVIGPYVTVASGCRISSSVISNSILNMQSSISNVVLDGSVIGSGAEVTGRRRCLNISDDSQVDLG
ncbi:MAG TPA: hypothetical protein VLA34_04265, partial [Candidatus Krumholzibacterium sp.]|nr:hypothetical protein [Candidatus Krumholzibacterium sp.]